MSHPPRRSLRLGLRFGCAALVALAALPVAAQAQTQLEMNQQAQADYTLADARLNAVYTRVMHDLAPSRRPLLIVAERDWITYRDAECAYQTFGSIGGSIHPLEVLTCRTELTRARAQTLARSDCRQGDPACQ